MSIVRTFTAGAAIAAGAYVQHDGANPGEVITAVIGTVVGADILVGVAEHGAASGETVSVAYSGKIVKAYAGAAITWGAEQALAVFTSALGRLRPAVAGDYVVAHYMGPGDAAAGELIDVLVMPKAVF